MQKIYVSGKITGLDNWRQIFEQAEKKLIEQGYFVISPRLIAEEVEIQKSNATYQDYMRSDLRMLCICDSVYFLSNWQDSPGARLEHEIAVALKLNCIYE